MTVNLENITSIYRELHACDTQFFCNLSDKELDTCEKIRAFMVGRGERTGKTLQDFDKTTLQTFDPREINRLSSKISNKEGLSGHPKAISEKAESLYKGLHSEKASRLLPEMWKEIAQQSPDSAVDRMIMAFNPKEDKKGGEDEFKAKVTQEIKNVRLQKLPKKNAEIFAQFYGKAELEGTYHPKLGHAADRITVYLDKNGIIKYMETTDRKTRSRYGEVGKAGLMPFLLRKGENGYEAEFDKDQPQPSDQEKAMIEKMVRILNNK